MKRDDGKLREWCAEAKARVLVSEVAERLGLKPSGNRFYAPHQSGRKPNASLTITAGGKGWRSYSGEDDGSFAHDIFGLVQYVHGYSTKEAILWVAREFGLGDPPIGKASGQPLPPPKPRPIPPKEAQVDSELVQESVLVASKCAINALPAWDASDEVADYLTQERGLSGRILTESQVRAIKDSADLRAWETAVADEVGPDGLKASGLRSLSLWERNDLFPAFLMPYLWRGSPIFWKARLARAKTDGLPCSRFFNSKGEIPCPYIPTGTILGDPSKDRLLICEGELDTLSAVSAGLQAIGIGGAKLWKDAWADLLRPWSGRIVIAYDGDESGRNGSEELAEKLALCSLPIPTRLRLPEGADLNEVLLSN